MTMIGSPACPLGRLEGQARGGGEGEGRCRLSSPPPKGATPCDRPPRGAILIPRPLGVVDYWDRGRTIVRSSRPSFERRQTRTRPRRTLDQGRVHRVGSVRIRPQASAGLWVYRTFTGRRIES